MTHKVVSSEDRKIAEARRWKHKYMDALREKIQLRTRFNEAASIINVLAQQRNQIQEQAQAAMNEIQRLRIAADERKAIVVPSMQIPRGGLK